MIMMNGLPELKISKYLSRISVYDWFNFIRTPFNKIKRYKNNETVANQKIKKAKNKLTLRW